jgi:hypothetical protein
MQSITQERTADATSLIYAVALYLFVAQIFSDVIFRVQFGIILQIMF